VSGASALGIQRTVWRPFNNTYLKSSIRVSSLLTMVKKVVITGIRGFIATALADRLRSEGWDVTGTDRCDSLDIRDRLREVAPNLIIHAAAEIYDESTMFESNVGLTRRILEHCSEVTPNCRLIALGSSSEYGKRNRPTCETDDLQPSTMYEGTKSAASMLVRAYSLTHGFQAALVRPYSVYGAGERAGRFLPFLLSLPTAIKVCPQAAHDFIYIDDFVGAVLAVIARQTRPYDVVNVGTGIMTTNTQLVETFEQVLGHKYEVDTTLPPKVNDTEMWVCNPAHLHKEYGFVPCIDLAQGIALMASIKGLRIHRPC
jgi:nucleoside-diphosphate-sugar epimerase